MTEVRAERCFFLPADPALVAAAERLAPENPFMTTRYLQARRELGFAVCAMGMAVADEPSVVTFGFLRRGRLNAELEISSAPSLRGDSPFWTGLAEYCRTERVTRLTINSFASTSVDIPPLGRTLDRYERLEYVIDLTVDDLMASASKSHRERIRKAARSGVTLERSRDPAELPVITSLHNASMDRRKSKGEVVPYAEESRELRTFLAHGCGEIYKAVLDGETVGAVFVLRAQTGAYSCFSGNSPVGMKCGASHYLTLETARQLQQDGLSVFNRSGVRPHETGLADFKRRFGAREVPLQSASFDIGGPIRRAITRVAGIVGARA